ncbi:MAG: cystathionine gamma-synthase [Polyangiaceae bacterium]|nr:cystathionine gamma-synthase [Polyangiaceae bacterium]
MKEGAKTEGLSLDTLAVHAGQPPDPVSGAVMMPIVLSSTFAQRAPGEHQGFEYGRSGNPTRRALEACYAALEGGKHGFAFGSGLGASTTLLSLLRSGDHVLTGDDVYGGTFRLLDKVMAPLGIESSFTDLSDIDVVRNSFRPNTRMVWFETPTNPLLKIFDIAKIASVARERGAIVVVDNTFATPVLQNPLALGATAVLHSATKYLNGHSDVIGGAVVTSDEELAQRLAYQQNALGAVPSPFDCYLVLRGIKTLPLRVRHASASAGIIADRLSRHKNVGRVIYPGLSSHKGHALASQQMTGFGAMISFVIKGGLEASKSFLSSLEIFACAESLGGVESLAEHPAIMTHASVPEAQRCALGIDDGLVRLSVGVESVDDLWADIERALGKS